MAPKSGSIFPFLDLPRELRDEIYKHALTTPSTIIPRPPNKEVVYDVPCTCSHPNGSCFRLCPRVWNHEHIEHHLSTAPFEPTAKPGLAAALLRTNRQIHEEAAMVLYGGNDFDCTVGITTKIPKEGKYVYNFVDNLSELPYRYLKHMRNVAISVQTHSASVESMRKTAILNRNIQGRLGRVANLWWKGHALRRLVLKMDELWVKEGPRKDSIGLSQKIMMPMAAVKGAWEVRVEEFVGEKFAETMVEIMMGRFPESEDETSEAMAETTQKRKRVDNEEDNMTKKRICESIELGDGGDGCDLGGNHT